MPNENPAPIDQEVIDPRTKRLTMPWLYWVQFVQRVVNNITLTGDIDGGPSSGTVTTTIANDAVTFAKMQNIATQRLIGRNTAGTGNPEEVTISQALDWLGE